MLWTTSDFRGLGYNHTNTLN